MRRRRLVRTGIVLAVAAVALTAGGAYAYFWESGRADVLAAGVMVDADAARALLHQRVVEPLARPLRLTA